MTKYITVVIFVYVFFLSKAQESDVLTRYKDKTRRVYWFDLAIKTRPDPDTRMPTYYIYPVSKVKYGTAEEYEYYLWSNISSGTVLAIGPFDTFEQAALSVKLYDKKQLENDSILLNDNNNYYYYIINLKRYNRLKAFDFERLPAAVATGKPKDFLTLIDASLKLDRLVIGAFASQPEAENSKRIFRLQE